MPSSQSEMQAPERSNMISNVGEPVPTRIGEFESHPSSIQLSDTTTPQSSLESPILELKSHIPAILLSEKRSRKGPKVETAKGPFSLLSLPRELRDNIYFYYLYRPDGVTYRRSKVVHWEFSFNGDGNPSSLYLASKQVYEEALRVFCRYNRVEIVARGNSQVFTLPGTLRLFPDKIGQILQRISRRYNQWSVVLYHDDPYSIPLMGMHWAGATAEARLCKDTFPKLREFTVMWYIDSFVFRERDHLEFENQTSEKKLEIWLGWMRRWAKTCNVVRAPYMRFEFCAHYGVNSMTAHEKELNEAHSIISKELGMLEHEAEDIEDSGNKWLEETWGEGLAENRKQKAKASKRLVEAAKTRGQNEQQGRTHQ